MRISVFGLGYVGAVSAACLASEGHDVVGVDVNPVKVDLVNRGQTPVIEADVAELLADAVASGRLRATVDCKDAVQGTDVAFVCVGTPSAANGSLDLSHLRRVCEEIGEAIPSRSERFVVVVRSTVLPGTTRDVVVPTLEAASGLTAGDDFGVCVNPEFLREGSAVADYFAPPKVVVGAVDEASGDLVVELSERPDVPVLRLDVELAELVKYADNTWHALKVAFANELGSISRAVGVDGQALMQAFCADEKLNISPAYLRPGFAFGGSCLPKDVRALRHRARTLDLDLPIVESILPSNERHIERAFRLVTDAGHRKVGVLGLSFKAGTDDLRESPMVELVERLLGKGYDVKVFDASVSLARLVGANRDFILNQVPHISDVLVGRLDEVLDHAGTVVVGNADPLFDAAVEQRRDGQVVVDFVRVAGLRSDGGGYAGLCW